MNKEDWLNREIYLKKTYLYVYHPLTADRDEGITITIVYNAKLKMQKHGMTRRKRSDKLNNWQFQEILMP